MSGLQGDPDLSPQQEQALQQVNVDTIDNHLTNLRYSMASELQACNRRQFKRQLSLSFKSCQLSSAFYMGYSCRIVAASHAAARGFSDTQIRELGRCSSDAFLRYIRF